jgi:hypothetical protein
MSITLSSISPPPVPIAGYASQSVARPARSEGVTDSISNRTDTNRTDTESRTTVSTEGEARQRPQQQTAEERQQQQVIQQLSARDREVRQHEMAHQAAGAGLTGAVSYSYQRGPDGRMYAVGGEVSIDTSPVSGDPRATLEKAEAIIRAAMAPAEPSPQDYRVAASARAMAAETRAELARMEEAEAEDESGTRPEQDERSAETRQDDENWRQRLAEMREEQADSINRLQRQLVDAGVFARMYPPGTLFNYQV